MIFLKDEFNEYLNEEGDIEICGSIFTRCKILEELESETYNLAFEEWTEDRKKNYLESFKDQIESDDSQKQRLNCIKELFRKDQITAFIGAGMSIPSGHEGWTSFLYNICNEYDCDVEQLQQHIQKGNYYLAAQELFEQIGEAAFQEKLDNTYSIEKKIIRGPIRFLPHLFNNNIITTNFDNIIERLYVDNRKPYEIVSGEHLQEVEKHLATANLKIYKIHGQSTSRVGRILTQNEYEKYYKDELSHYKVIESFSKNTILFLGCSLVNDEIIKVLEKITEQKGSTNIAKHYAFLQVPEEEAQKIELKRKLSKSNIFPIWYDTDHDEAIEALFWALINEKERV